MKYLAALDYDHLDNGVFLTSFGKALARQQDTRAIILHGESEYTERLIQTGIMREEARIRCIKDLNHRLVALLADQGVSTVGLNGYQKKIITLKNDELKINKDFFDRLPGQPVLLLSNLVLDIDKDKPVPVDLADFLEFLQTKLAPDETFLFSKEHQSGTDPSPPQTKEQIPDEFGNMDPNINIRLTTAPAFGKLPDLKGSVKLNELK